MTLTDPESGATHYTYDTLNRLTGLNDFQSHNFTFSYDALSRRTQLTRPNGVNKDTTFPITVGDLVEPRSGRWTASYPDS